MGLDVTFFAGNPSTRQARMLGQFRNLWWVVDYLEVPEDRNGCDIEIGRDALERVAYNPAVWECRQGKEVAAVCRDAIKNVDWGHERMYVNCWW